MAYADQVQAELDAGKDPLDVVPIDATSARRMLRGRPPDEFPLYVAALHTNGWFYRLAWDMLVEQVSKPTDDE